MRSLLLLIFLLCIPGSPAKKIQVGKFTYTLESVLRLKDVLEREDMDLEVSAGKICHSSDLPEEFHPVCVEDDASDIFIKLVEAANNFDECEICAHPACPGCI
ncbi:guanylin-like [Mixophyes fleayi]|uniref:guanylin-like n=1 Tax=Mixophyes fleayi TaxID=3061075 RepID=UPI003F4E10E2